MSRSGPADAEIIERVPVCSRLRRGAAIDLVPDRGRENRSQLVVTNARGRQIIFWRTARTAKQARLAVAVPEAQHSGLPTWRYWSTSASAIRSISPTGMRRFVASC